MFALMPMGGKIDDSVNNRKEPYVFLVKWSKSLKARLTSCYQLKGLNNLTSGLFGEFKCYEVVTKFV